MQNKERIKIGSRRELFVDDLMVASLTGGARRMMHAPQPREIAMVHDRAWEGNTCGYFTFFHDGPGVRAYYRGSQSNPRIGGGSNNHQFACLAESDDGIQWRKPALHTISFQGSTLNNIVHDGAARHNFAPFKDTHPGCPEDQRYKALGGSRSGLIAYGSHDGIHWKLITKKPVITDGFFDSQNLAFWDEAHGLYRAYYRDFRGCTSKDGPSGSKGGGTQGVREIKMATSPDFIKWTKGKWLDYSGAPSEELYTNQVMPCPGAPHLLIGLPTRFLPERGQIVEGLLMSSRDGLTFQRWNEALLRPGLNRERWGNRSNYIWNGIIETPSDLPGAPSEWSIYSTEGYYEGAQCHTRRFSLRVDGFVSVNAPMSGGELLTPTLTFAGNRLLLNCSTAAAGSIRVELQTPDQQPIKGFELNNCVDIWGDTIEHQVAWKDNPELGKLAGQPVRLKFSMADADLYSFRFAEAKESVISIR